MDTFRILFLRKNNTYDGLLKEAVKLIDKKTEVKYGDISQFEEYLHWKESGDCKLYDILIIYGKDKEQILKFANQLPALSTVRLYDGESGKKEPIWIDNKLFEEYPTSFFSKSIICLSRFIIRNSIFLKELYKRQALSKALMKLIPDGAVLFNTQGIIINSNARISGFTPGELIGKSIFAFIDETEIDNIREMMKKSLKNSGDVNLKTRIKKKDGTLLPIEVNAKLIIDYRGRPANFLAVLTDVRMKKEARRNQLFLKHLIESSREGIVAADKDLKITMWNRGAGDILGYTPEEVLGKSISIFCPDEEAREKQELYIELIKKEGHIKNYIAPRQCKDGKVKYIGFSITAFYDEEGEFTGISAILRDLSEMEITLKETQKKNEEMEHLINVVSHDLRSPLHSIDNYISLIRESIGNELQDEKVLEMFERIHANINNMESLIKDLTEFSRAGITSKDEMSVDLNSVVREIVRNIQWQVGRKNFLMKTENLPIIRINPGRIHRVFENLLTNAHKFCVEGKPVEVEIRGRRHNDKIRFSIKDHGIGINSEHHDKIFNLFYRTKEKIIDGSGAGLAIARKIIRSYGGDIWFESEKNKGTTFYFTIPASRIIEE
ncbi:MAG: PAS domain-containing sensor histidine kinase [Candidatus Eremiobacteraeota bacterium]|nr:PAS domain-containing sensor histidine kinase [Candidatus Eremiobacteraeota bacterium]